jgi:hypothetical protein
LVWPTRVRHRERKHAFEEALDEARLTPDDGLDEFLDEVLSNPASGPAVGSLGDITVASGYVAPSSLAKAYGSDAEPPEPEPVVAPAEAARKLKDRLGSKEHTTEELTRMRRRFAAENHPDKVAAELREEAVAAMADVNAAIDRALKKGKLR